MKILLALILACCSVSAAIHGNLFVDFEGGSNGEVVTTNLMNSVTHGSVGNGWITSSSPEAYISGPVPYLTISEDAAFPLYTSVTVDGTNYSDAGTRGMRCVMDTAGSNSVDITFTAASNPFSLGFNFRFNGAKINDSPRDVVGMRDAVGGFQLFQLYDGTVPYVHAHWKPPSTQNGPNVNLVKGRWYWATMVHVAGGQTTRVHIYDTTDGYSLTGASTGLVENTVNGPARIQFGTIKYNAGSSQSIDFDNIVFNLDGVFPLGPFGVGHPPPRASVRSGAGRGLGVGVR